jgi:hypothetical protein
MFTDEGLESFLQGFIGGGTIAAGGKAINRALRSNKNSAVEINKYIDNLSQLNIQKNITQDQDVKDALDLIEQNSQNNSFTLSLFNKLSAVPSSITFPVSMM